MGGEAVVSSPPTFQVQIAGTDDVERVEPRRDLQCVDSLPAISEMARSENEVRISWRGARNRGRERAARWDGSIECHGTKIERVRGYVFDSPAEGIREVSEDEVVWESVKSLRTAKRELSGTASQPSRGMLLLRQSSGKRTTTAKESLKITQRQPSGTGKQPSRARQRLSTTSG